MGINDEHRERVDAIMCLPIGNLTVARIDAEAFWDAVDVPFRVALPREVFFLRSGLATPEQQAAMRERRDLLKPTRVADAFLVREGQKLVAAFLGWQSDEVTYYMQTSAVHPDFRRQGLYSELARRVIEYTKASGFLRVTSNHAPSNNPVIIAKLKLGFRITSLEMDAEAGPSLWLCYFHSEELLRAYEFRCGIPEFSTAMMEASCGSADELREKLDRAHESKAENG